MVDVVDRITGEVRSQYLPPAESIFEQEGKDFLPAPDIERIARRLLDTKDQFAAVGDAEITYLWKRQGGQSNGRLTLGKCIRLSGLARHGIGGDFVIWLAADNVRDCRYTSEQVEALTFHELMHVSYDDESGKWSIRGHDFEGFLAELAEYGAWDTQFQRMAEQAQQLPLAGL